RRPRRPDPPRPANRPDHLRGCGMSSRPDFEATHTAAGLDLGYDREYASDRVSRYGAYLRDRAWWWADDDPQSDLGYLAARTAARCWEIANGPIVAPGLVSLHPRI